MVVKVHISKEKLFDTYVSQFFGVSGFEVLERFGVTRSKLNDRYEKILDLMIKFLFGFNSYKLPNDVDTLYRAIYVLVSDSTVENVRELVEKIKEVEYWYDWNEIIDEFYKNPYKFPMLSELEAELGRPPAMKEIINELKTYGYEEIPGVGVFRYDV